jgi:hypothetical protein
MFKTSIVQWVYKDEYLKFGFTDNIDRSGLVRLQRLYCLKVLLNKFIKVNKLKRHLNTFHSPIMSLRIKINIYLTKKKLLMDWKI